MRNSEHYITTTGSEPLATDDETTWSFPGAIIGFVSWLLALGIPFLMYGGNTLFGDTTVHTAIAQAHAYCSRARVN